jgi:protein-tyrosine-phosphatase
VAHPVEVLVVCTGNAARSVMAGFMLEQRALDAGVAVRLTTAGTHAIEGLPVSWRTSEAVAQVEALRGAAELRRHRSRQVDVEHLDRADVVIGMETDHVRWVRRFRPEVAGATATMKRLCRDLQPGAEPLGDRLRSLRLADVELEGWEDVVDPAGHDLDVYVARAHEIWELSGDLVTRL